MHVVDMGRDLYYCVNDTWAFSDMDVIVDLPHGKVDDSTKDDGKNQNDGGGVVADGNGAVVAVVHFFVSVLVAVQFDYLHFVI